MKKKHAILPLLAISVLSSCRYKGKEITSDTARVNELEQAISVKMGEVKNYEAHIVTAITEIYVDAIEYDYDSELIYRVDEKGSIFLSASLTLNDQKSEITSYAVDSENYGKVVYTVTKNITTKQTFTDVYSVIENEGSSSAGNTIPTIISLPVRILETIFDPLTYAETFDKNHLFSANYYSKGDGNLTIEGTEAEYGGDYFGKRHVRTTFDNYVLSYAKIESETQPSVIERRERYEINFKELSALSITLPDDWEARINKSSSAS